MAPLVPTLTLNNGHKIPIIGLGTWKSSPGEVTQAVKDAIDIGYRHIDCAYLYENENEVGDAITAKINEGVVKRENLFIVSKLWNSFHRPDLVRGAFETSLKSLGLKYIDLYLIHWPMGYLEDGEPVPRNEKGEILFSTSDYLDTYKELEKLVDEGLVRSIGVSNFNRAQLERILLHSRIPPTVNQVESHPYLAQKKLLHWCLQRNIILTAYSPLGSPDRPWAKPGDPLLLEDSRIVEIAQKYNKSPAQVLIRYQIERRVVVIPKSVTKRRIAQNFDVFNFQLTKNDMDKIDEIDCNGRLVAHLADTGTHKDYPFHDEY